MTTADEQLAFIGAGNMASSIIGGLISRGTNAQNITVSDAQPAQMQRASETFSVKTASSNSGAVEGVDTVLLAVKPDVMQSVCSGIAAAIDTNTLVISVAAGVRVDSIRRWLGKDMAIVRCMPNTPALLNLGANALFGNLHSTAAKRARAEALLGATGITCWVESEQQIDIVTALSGSGPAYFFHLIECMTEAATEMGLDAGVAETLAIQTAYGAAAMARESQLTPAQLRENVTSKGGTTAAALASFADAEFRTIVARAMAAAQARAQVMGDELA